jgi:hypothetical protein
LSKPKLIKSCTGEEEEEEDYLTFMCRSTCFGRIYAHHQELTPALTAYGFTLKCGGSSAATTTSQDKTRVY